MPQRPSATRTRRVAIAGLAAASAVAVPAAAMADPFAGGTKVPKHAVAGDGAAQRQTGGIALTDGVGAKWFLNTNITFSTTSSASAAASEASFTGPVVASTVGGGTTESTLNDAFDGYNALATFVGTGAPTGDLVGTGTPGVTFYNKNGVEPTTSCDDRNVVYPTQTNGDIQVSRQVYVPADAGFARWTNTVTNTSATATTATLYIKNNLGSDSNTLVFDTSTGATGAATTDDTWVGSFQNFSGSTSSDPREGHVIQGEDAPSGVLTDVHFVDGDDNPYWAYTVALAPGETKSILNYTVLRGLKSDVASAAASIASAPSFACMSNAEVAKVVNFKVDQTPPVITVPATITKPATGPDGATVHYTVSANDDVDGSVPATCTPASGSVFPIGTTTVTCTATDAAGNTSTKNFTVKVTPLVPLTLGGVSVDGATVHFTVPKPVDVRFRLIRTFVQGDCYGRTCRPSVDPAKIGRRIGEITFHAAKGKDKHQLSGKLAPSKLKPGRYRLLVTVTDDQGAKKSVSTHFVVKS